MPFQLFRGHNKARLDVDEFQLFLAANPKGVASDFLKQRDPLRREAIIEFARERSIAFAASCIEVSQGKATLRNESALKEAVGATGLSQQFADCAVALGLLDESLAHAPSNSSRLCKTLKFLFHPNNITTIADREASIRYQIDLHQEDSLILNEVFLLIDSFDQLRADCGHFGHILGTHAIKFEDKILTAAKLSLLIQSDELLRGAERVRDVSVWIDYGPTEVDRELMDVWMRHCDPLMRAGYQMLVSDALEDPSERGKHAKEVLTLINQVVDDLCKPNYSRILDITELVIHSLQVLGLDIDVPAYVIKNKLSKVDLTNESQASTFLELQMREMVRAQAVLDIIFESHHLVRKLHDTNQHELIDAEEIKLLSELLPSCITEYAINSHDDGSKRDSLISALKINDPKPRICALKLLFDLSTPRFAALCETASAEECASIATALLSSKIGAHAFRWLEKHPVQAIPEAKRFLYSRGIKDDASAIYCLTLIAQDRSPDAEFAHYVEKLYRKSNHTLTQIALLKALGQVIDLNDIGYAISIFSNARWHKHLRIEATNGLAVCGSDGLEHLHSELQSSFASIDTDLHGRRTPELDVRQQEILHALPRGGQGGAIILRSFLYRFPDCNVTHLISNFLRGAKQPFFGMNEGELLKALNQYSDS